MRKDSVPASRYVVINPFTVLARLTSGMESLSIPKLIPEAARQSGYRPRAARSSSYSSPTPIGSVRHVMADWKSAIVEQSKGRRKNKTEQAFDELAQDLEEGWIEMRDTTRHGRTERW